MGKKKPNTPRSRIKAAIRQLWLRSRERAATLKRDGYCCQSCGVKQSKAKGKEQKVEVHHIEGIDVWSEVVDLIAELILCIENVDKLITLCPDCHKEEHKKEEVEGCDLQWLKEEVGLLTDKEIPALILNKIKEGK